MSRPILEIDRRLLVERLERFSEELRGARLFLTGGTGFVGSWLLEGLLAACEAFAPGLSVTVLSRQPDAFRRRASHLAQHEAVRLVTGDVRDFKFPAEAFRYVIHAAFDSSRALMPEEIRSTVVNGTARCLEVARRCDAERVLYVSSGAVYGQQPPGVAHVTEAEDQNVWPRTGYGDSKKEAERLALESIGQGGPPVVIARCFAFVGPHLPLDAHFAIGNFIKDALSGGPIRVRGDGSPVRSYLYAADLAIWLLTILVRGAPGSAYNVGSEKEISVAELARLVASAIDASLRVELARSASGGSPERYVPSTARARGQLGLSETVDLPEAIRRTAEWHRKIASVTVH